MSTPRLLNAAKACAGALDELCSAMHESKDAYAEGWDDAMEVALLTARASARWPRAAAVDGGRLRKREGRAARARAVHNKMPVWKVPRFVWPNG